MGSHGRLVGVDVGGTFTDVALVVDEQLVTAKVPTTDDQGVGVIEGIEKACEELAVDPDSIEGFVHAMTVSVNAILERAGARTALVTTEGFRDVLEIGRQDRPSLYDLNAEKPTPLVPRRRRFEVSERAGPEGIERSVDTAAVRAIADELRAADVESVAVSFLHAYATPENEQAVAERLREWLDIPVSASSEVLAEFREYERTATTTVDAYVTPTIDGYIGRLVDRAADAGLPTPRIMQSNGGIADADTVRTHAVTTVLSGPAAGVIGAADIAVGDGLVTFDMGGTSSDVSLVRDGSPARTTDTEIDGVPIRTPMVDVNTVGAGGGSIAWVDAGGAVRVGPTSAGAEPGPVCYGRGGEKPTVTDANVVLGFIGPETALGGELTLDIDAAHAAMDELAEDAALDSPLEAARGVYRVANATMTRAIRSVTVERGLDPRGFGLVAFGGAGPMHAATLATALDIERVIVPKSAGVLSAYGLLAANESHDAVRTVHADLRDVTVQRIDRVYDELIEAVLSEVSDRERATMQRAADCRYVGQSFERTVPVDGFHPASVADQFEADHESAYGYTLDEAVEVVNLRVTAEVQRPSPDVDHVAQGTAKTGERAVHFPDTGARTAAVYARNRLATDSNISGPAILEQPEATTVVPPGWIGSVRGDGTLVMEVTG